MSASSVLALVASLVFLGRLLPQPIRTFRTKELAGVSSLAALNALVADVTWLAYGLRAGIPAVWLVSVPAVALSAWSVALLRRSVTVADSAAAGLWVAALVGSAAAGLLTLALAGTVVVICGPQLWAAYRHRSPSGISTATWLVSVLDAAAWGAYGLTIANGALELYAAVMIVTAAAILARLAWLRRVPAAGATAP